MFFNGEMSENSQSCEQGRHEERQDYMSCSRIDIDEIKEATRRMKLGKAMDSYYIFDGNLEVLRDEGLIWLIELFNVTFRTANMPSEWRINIVIHFTKTKGDIQSCNNYRGMKLLNHMMKL